MKKYSILLLLIILILLCVEVFYSKKENTERRDDAINSNVLRELNNYFEDVETQTNRNISDNQRQFIRGFLNKTDVYKLDPETIKIHRKDFDKKRKSLIKEWENIFKEKWPKYSQNVVIKGKVVRRTGQNYDAHHIIELSWNGENAWWNLTPAAFPNEHQKGIHRKGGLAATLFGEIPDYVGE